MHTTDTGKECCSSQSKTVKISGALALAIILAAGIHSVFFSPGTQHDFRVYYFSASASRLGLDPYKVETLTKLSGVKSQFAYVYPPITLYIFYPFTWFNLHVASRGWLMLKVASVGLLALIWHHLFHLFTDKRAWLLVLIPIAFNASLMRDLLPGNVSTFEQLLIWSGFYCYLRGWRSMFGLLIILAALCKIVPILFLGFLALRLRRRDIIIMLVSGLLFAGIFFLNRFLWPALDAQFMHLAFAMPASQDERGIVNPCTFAACQDAMQWIANQAKLNIPHVASVAMYLVVACVAGLISLGAIRRLHSVNDETADLLRICLFCFLYAIVMPRFKDYSYILLIAPSLYILVYSRWINYLIPCCLLLIFWYFEPWETLGNPLQALYQIGSQYYCLWLAWALWAICVANIYRYSDEYPTPTS